MKNKRFNLFDLLVIIIILGIAAALIFRNQIKDLLVTTELKTFAVTVHSDAISNSAINELEEGGELYLRSGSNPFGTVKEIKTSPAYETLVVGTQEVQKESSYFSVLDLVLTVEGYESEGSYFAKDGTPLLVREKLVLENDSSRYSYTVTAVVITGE
ncbi:MAG: hypothetical protein J6T77_00235 [Clostridia bacterium]|nr:hypothetical protein [Clostridia bacterium]